MRGTGKSNSNADALSRLATEDTSIMAEDRIEQLLTQLMMNSVDNLFSKEEIIKFLLTSN